MSGQRTVGRATDDMGFEQTNADIDDASMVIDDPDVDDGVEVVERDTRPRLTERSLSMKNRLILADFAALAFGVALAFAIQAVLRPVPRFVMADHALLVVASVPGFAIGAGVNHLYQARANQRRLEEARNVIKTVGFGMSGMLLVSIAIQYDELSRLWVSAMVFTITAAVLFERRIARSIFAKLRQEGKLQRRIIIVGTDAHAIGLMHAYERNPSLGYQVVGFAGSDDLGARGGVEVLGPIDDLTSLLEDKQAVGVVVSLASVPSDDVNTLTRRLTDAGYHVALSSSLRDIDVTRLRPQTLDGRTMIYVEPIVRNGWRGAAKRAFDVVLALADHGGHPARADRCRDRHRGVIEWTGVLPPDPGRHGRAAVRGAEVPHDVPRRRSSQGRVDEAQNEADGPLFKMKNDPGSRRSGGSSASCRSTNSHSCSACSSVR